MTHVCSCSTKDDQQLNSAKLATYNEVLRSYISFREDCVRNSKDVTLTKREAANQTVHELKEQYERANIPIVAPHIMREVTRIIITNSGKASPYTKLGGWGNCYIV